METLSIEKSLNNRWHQKLKVQLGRVFSCVSPGRADYLFDHPTSQPQGIKDKAIMAYLKHRATKRNQVEFFDRLHKDVWKSDEGVFFARNCETRFEEMSLKMQQQEFQLAIELCKKMKPTTAVELGCSSAPVLSYLTQTVDSIESAVGIDINEEQIQSNNRSSKFDARFSFVAGDAHEWLIENGKPNSLYITNGGVLEYFPRERLCEMLRYISEELSPSVFFAVEPIADDHDWTKNPESIPFGDELSFSHNYQDAFSSSGFEIIHQRPVVYEQWKMMATIATTGTRIS